METQETAGYSCQFCGASITWKAGCKTTICQKCRMLLYRGLTHGEISLYAKAPDCEICGDTGLCPAIEWHGNSPYLIQYPCPCDRPIHAHWRLAQNNVVRKAYNDVHYQLQFDAAWKAHDIRMTYARFVANVTMPKACERSREMRKQKDDGKAWNIAEALPKPLVKQAEAVAMSAPDPDLDDEIPF